ncbi:YhgE/Pip domain-containing protein [Paenibacillus sp. FSL R7-0179]|uniref:YhgE/Pip domain-containing protein n=1 Tax=Paenibacillus sp. FSL R7-0179 TaxID=2921672 RepID=UPI0030F9AAE7
MKEIWQIYQTDWLRLFKIPVALLLIAALVILPSIYDWLNVAAVWDPYSNTSGINIAVASLDQGAEVKGTRFNIGAEVLDSLRSNKKLGWRFTDAQQAVEGVRRGDYYASIVIPPEFSERMTGILKGKLEKPELEYTVNEKINAIAPKITDKGASTVTAQITEHFTKTLSSTVLTSLYGIDKEFQSELPAIRRVESGLFRLEAELPELEKASRLVLKLQRDWPEISTSAARIAGLTARLPEVEQAGKTAEAIDGHWQQITDAAEQLNQLQDKLPKLERAALLVSELDSNFGKVDLVLGRAMDRLEQARSVIAAAAQALPAADRLAAAGSSFGLKLQQFLDRNAAAFAAVPEVLQQHLYLLQQAGDTAVQWAAPSDAARLPLASARLSAAAEGLAHTGRMLAAVNVLAPGTAGAGDLHAIAAARELYRSAADQAAAQAAQPGTAGLQQVREAAAQAAAALDGIIPRYNAEIMPALGQALGRLTADAGQAAGALQQVPQRLEALDTVLDEAGAVIRYGQDGLTALAQELPAVREQVHGAAANLTQKMAQLHNLFANVLPRVQAELPQVGGQIHEVAEYSRKELPAAEVKFRRAADVITTGLPQAGQGVNRAAAWVRSDLPALIASVRHGAKALRGIKQEVDLKEVAELLSGNIQGQSDFLANPVVLRQQNLYPIPNYGSAMTPFYVVLSLWVGGTLMISLLRTSVDSGGRSYRSYQVYLGRLLTFLTIGILQALVAVLGNIFLLGCYVADPVWFVLSAVLISLIFVTIIFTLVSVFGSIGKGIAIVFMVLQFSSSGGTFPISTTGHVFQAINPYMPFTYAISLLREGVGGLLPEVAFRDALLLVLFGVLSLLIGLTLRKPLQGFIRRTAAKVEKSKLIS